MVAEGLTQHIVAEGVLANFFVAVGPAADHHLGAAEIGTVGIVNDVNPLVYAVLEVCSQLEDSGRAEWKSAVDGNSYA